MSVESLMNRKVNIQRRTKTIDGTGTATETWTTIYTDMPCRIQPVGGMVQTLYARQVSQVSHKMFYPAGYPSVAEQDRVIDGANSYDVRFVSNPDFSDHHYEAALRDLREVF